MYTKSKKIQVIRYAVLFPLFCMLILGRTFGQDLNTKKYELLTIETIDTMILYDPATHIESVKIVKNSEDYYKTAEVLPSWQSCTQLNNAERQKCSDAKLLEFISANLKYPSTAQKNGSQGTSIIRFIVLNTGMIDFISVLQSSSNKDLDNAAKKVVQATSGKWNPGKIKGKKVNVEYILPVKFKMTE